MAFPEDRDRRIQRQTHETLLFADDLIDWLGRNNPLRTAAGQAPIAPDEEFQLLSLRRKAASLFRSSRVPVAAAVYGPSQVGKSLFVGQVIAPKIPTSARWVLTKVEARPSITLHFRSSST